MIHATLVGSGPFKAKMEAAARAGTPTLASVLYREGNAIMTAAKQDYVPVDTGALRASGFVEKPTVSRDSVFVLLGFGGPSAPYALIVHEDLTKRHPVGSAKYLEIPYRARVFGMPDVVATRMRMAVRQAFQRLAKVQANVDAGRDVNWGMPAYGAA